MNQPDQNLLEEAYQLVQEGLLDRLKARGSQALASVKGAGHQIVGKAKQVSGNLLNKAVTGMGNVIGQDTSKSSLAQKGQDLAKAGASQRNTASKLPQEAKYRSYINNAAQTLVADLEKLGMPIKDRDQLVAALKTTLMSGLQQVTSKGQLRTAKGQIGNKII